MKNTNGSSGVEPAERPKGSGVEPAERPKGSGVEHRSLDRLLRMFGRFVGTGYVIYFALLFSELVRTADLTSWWWPPFAGVTVFGSGVALGLATFLTDIRWTRIAAGVAAMSYLFAVGTWIAAWDGVSFDVAGLYLSTFPGLAALAAALVWRPAVVAVYLVTVVLVIQWSNARVRQPFVEPTLFADIAFAIMFCTIFVAALLGALRTARILDATIAATQANAASAAAAAARDVERERFDALIHDGVMSSLLSVARQGRTESVARQARATLDQLDALRSYSVDSRFDRVNAVAHLRAAATDADESVSIEVGGASDPGTTYPAEAVRATGAALAEAVRNSVKHAGEGVIRMVSVTAESGRLAVSVSDDGVGFDPDSIPPHRLGVAVSIHGRMRQLDGGSAVVSSAAGAGTTVHLQWEELA